MIIQDGKIVMRNHLSRIYTINKENGKSTVLKWNDDGSNSIIQSRIDFNDVNDITKGALIEIFHYGVFRTYKDREDLIAPCYDIVMKNLVKQIEHEETIDMYEVFEKSKKEKLLGVENEEDKEKILSTILSNEDIQGQLLGIAEQILPPESIKADLDIFISYEDGKAMFEAKKHEEAKKQTPPEQTMPVAPPPIKKHQKQQDTGER